MAFTYFFRDRQTLDVAAEHLATLSMGSQSVMIWDAGCAMGPEPYTLAMILAESMGQYSFRNVKILATDIDGSDLFQDIIDEAVYPYDQVERIPREYLEKYFTRTDGNDCYRISDHIKNRVRFQKHDLLSLSPVGTGFSMILCKNVLLHFHHEQRVQVISMFHKTLSPGGLFVTEQTQKMPTELEPYFEQVVSNVQLFRKVGNLP